MLAAMRILTSAVLAILLATASSEAERVSIFEDDLIHFNTEMPDSGARAEIEVIDNGRRIYRTVSIAPFPNDHRVFARVEIDPIPKDEIAVHDKWDRAGSIRIATENGQEAELVKFITAYGGHTVWEVDVTHLAPLLSGEVTIGAFIDTWVSPAWHVSVDLSSEPGRDSTRVAWNQPVMLVDNFDLETYGDSGYTTTVAIPDIQERVLLYYYVSGHCTDGRGADEFMKKDNVILVNDRVVYRYQPWRDDCRDFRAINPYTRRWSSGMWSSDYDRSGWCPGDIVSPLVLDLTDHLPPGEHAVTVRIDDIRPADESGKGYWRTSVQLVGITYKSTSKD